MKCKGCGSKQKSKTKYETIWECGSIKDDQGEVFPGIACHERQIETLKARVAELEEQVKKGTK